MIKHVTRLFLSHDSTECYGWVGGTAPAWFDHVNMPDGTATDHIDVARFGFFFTVAVTTDMAVSVFLPKTVSGEVDFDALIEHRSYPDCSIAVVRHPLTTETAVTDFALRTGDGHPLFQQTWLSGEDNGEPPFLIFAPTPELIQDESEYFEQLEADSYVFFATADEDGYLDDTFSEYPLGYGALYLYAKDNEVIAGFWQSS